MHCHWFQVSVSLVNHVMLKTKKGTDSMPLFAMFVLEKNRIHYSLNFK